VKLVIILGTRPEIVKMSPIIRECEKQNIDYFILHTGQHYDYNLDGIFFEQLKLPKPKYNLKVGSGTYAEEVSKMLIGIERVLLQEKPSVALLEGDSIIGDTTLVFQDSKDSIKLMTIGKFASLFFSGEPSLLRRDEALLEGWKVLSVTDDGEGCFRPIKSIIRHNVHKDIVRVRTLESEVSVTKDHSLYTHKNGEFKASTSDNIDMLSLLRNVKAQECETKLSLIKGNFMYPSMWKRLSLCFPANSLLMRGKIAKNARRLWNRHTKDYRKVKLTQLEGEDIILDELKRAFIINGMHIPKSRMIPYVTMTKELCWILGFYMAEGSLIRRPDGTVQLYIYNQDLELLEKIKGDIEKQFGVSLPVPKFYRCANVGRLVLPCVFAYLFLEILDVGIAECKQVPPIMYHLPLEMKQSFLDGYMAGDGYLKEQEVVMKSKSVRDSLIFLLITMNMNFTIKFNRYKDRRKHIYALKILGTKKHGHNRQGKIYKEECFGSIRDYEIKDKVIVGREAIVYDLSVEGTQRFVTAHGVILHNTNSCIAGALAASKCGIPIGHMEAGLRSYFAGMPEEINRVVVDHVSNLLFAPTESAKNILLNEGILDSKIFVTGNTIVDAVYQNLESIENSKHYPIREKYALATVHRQENVDNLVRFASIMKGLGGVASEFKMPVVYPMHPRAKKMFDILRRGVCIRGVEMIEPVDYLQFLWLEKNASLVLTDSGGVQEECCILGIPCVTLRDNTERPETVGVGANMLAGASAERIVECSKEMIGKSGWIQPFGDGKASGRIIEIVRRHCG
jgi:UDP-N-acetylglucosamine 2-epimerase (non-hydrolysing)